MLTLKQLPLVLLFLLAGCAWQRQDEYATQLSSINLIDRNGISETITNAERLKKYANIDFLTPQPYQKVLRVFATDSQGNIDATITSYHPNGQLKQYLEASNNRAFGLYREYYLDGVMKLEAYVIGGTADLNTAAEKTWLFDRCSNAWNQDGNLIAQIQYTKGDLNGYSIYYHSNSNVWKRVPFERNEIHGILEIYLESGDLLQTTEYTHGTKTGRSLRYWNGSLIASEECYNKGLLTTANYYDKCGQPICSIESGEGYLALFSKDGIAELHEYHNGVLDGEVKVYDSNERLTKIYHKKNSLKHGEYVEFYEQKPESGTPIHKLSIMYDQGHIQGIVKTWYENGIQESQREMSQNVKNGMAIGWYEDGSLMMIEEYDHDKLARGEYYKKGERIPISQIAQGNGIATLFNPKGHFLRKVNYYNNKPQD